MLFVKKKYYENINEKVPPYSAFNNAWVVCLLRKMLDGVKTH